MLKLMKLYLQNQVQDIPAVLHRAMVAQDWIIEAI